MPHWRSLPPHSRRWVLWQFVVIAAIVNFILTGGIAWLLTLQQDSVQFAGIPLVDHTTVIVDTLGTLFVLPFLTTLVVTTVVRHELQHGELDRLSESRLSRRLPTTLLRRAALVGATCLVAFSPPVALGLLLAGSHDMSIAGFVLFKAIFGAVYGLAVTPVIALLAIEEQPAGTTSPSASTPPS